MAEIIAKFDTKTKKLEVLQDGQAVDNVARCSFGKGYDGEYMCIVDMIKNDKENSLTETKTLYASKNSETDKIKADIVNYLNARISKNAQK